MDNSRELERNADVPYISTSVGQFYVPKEVNLPTDNFLMTLANFDLVDNWEPLSPSSCRDSEPNLELLPQTLPILHNPAHQNKIIAKEQKDSKHDSQFNNFI